MICLFLGAVLCGGTAAAQHTLGVTGIAVAVTAR